MYNSVSYPYPRFAFYNPLICYQPFSPRNHYIYSDGFYFYPYSTYRNYGPYFYSYNPERSFTIPTPNIPTSVPTVPTPNIPTSVPTVPTPNIPTSVPTVPTPNIPNMPTPNIPTPWSVGGNVTKQVASVFNKLNGQVVEQANMVTKEAKERARQEWENLKTEVQSQVMQEVQNQFESLKQEAINAGMDYVHTNFGELESFANQAIEWGMEIRDAIERIREMIRMIRSLLENFNKHCNTSYSTPINLISVNIPVINKSYEVRLELCYPFNPATIGQNIMQKCQETTIRQASETIMQGVIVGAASGGTGIIPALSESFSRAISEAPGVFASCIQKEFQQALGKIELFVIMG
ncbi:hypothetical protein P4H65_26870 [Paenibacillus chitinolyticus]|uniref:hypothetical protein n=1 Tax=Paenibacillus chitinolyticus TaxID=79263 RepID=UPI002DBBB1B3|nr:hypothetical protein [Paenibacillus chitinolyticus]MEC0249408.1 hypothetical protein [Paenibacillus chitinolyticus]